MTTTPSERITAYFEACSQGSAADIAAHFTDHAVVYDTNIDAVRGSRTIGDMWVRVRERWAGAVWTVDSIVEAVDGVATAIERTLIAGIHQYWTFDAERLDTGLVGFEYPIS